MPPAAVPASTPNLNPSMDLVVAAGRERMVLISGVLAGICVFFAPLLVLALGLLGAYLTNLISDGAIPVFDLARPLAAEVREEEAAVAGQDQGREERRHHQPEHQVGT